MRPIFTTSIEEYYKKMSKRIEGMQKNEAIEFLKERIFIEEMADFMDFKYVEACEKIIKELENQ